MVNHPIHGWVVIHNHVTRGHSSYTHSSDTKFHICNVEASLLWLLCHYIIMIINVSYQENNNMWVADLNDFI